MKEEVPLELIIRYLSREASFEEQEQLLAWISISSANRSLFHAYQGTWEHLSFETPSFDVGNGLARLNSRIDVEERKNKMVSVNWGKLAASAVLVFTISAGLYYAIDTFLWISRERVYVQHVSPVSGKLTIHLPDGSQVKLNSNSSLKYIKEFSRNKREVLLEGEAFFDVTKDPSRPFIVHTGRVSTRVLGTAFNINGYDEKVSVVVSTGKVSVGVGDNFQVLLPNEKITYNLSTAHFKKEHADLSKELAWKNNVLLFEDLRMEEVAIKLEKWYGISVDFANAEAKECVVTGKYKNEPLENVLEAVTFSTGLHFTMKNNDVTLSGKGCDDKQINSH